MVSRYFSLLDDCVLVIHLLGIFVTRFVFFTYMVCMTYKGN